MSIGHIKDTSREDSGLTGEKNDCTIRAYANMTGMDYIQAYGKFYLAGRRCKRGTTVHYEIYNAEFVRLNRPNMTVRRFIETIAHTGNWIIQIRGHVFCVRDRQIIDRSFNNLLNCHVTMAWMTKAKETK